MMGFSALRRWDLFKYGQGNWDQAPPLLFMTLLQESHNACLLGHWSSLPRRLYILSTIHERKFGILSKMWGGRGAKVQPRPWGQWPMNGLPVVYTTTKNFIDLETVQLIQASTSSHQSAPGLSSVQDLRYIYWFHTWRARMNCSPWDFFQIIQAAKPSRHFLETYLVSVMSKFLTLYNQKMRISNDGKIKNNGRRLN